MKLQMLTVMLLLLQCSTYVLSLRCYTCNENEHDTECKVETDCDSTAQYCKGMYEGENIFKSCEEFCEVDINTDCCETDLCN